MKDVTKIQDVLNPKIMFVPNIKDQKETIQLIEDTLRSVHNLKGIHRCKTSHLWNNNYRTNVWYTNNIQHSYFINASPSGILYSSPEIPKCQTSS